MMLIPRRNNDFDFFDEMFHDPFFTKQDSRLMRTDIKNKDGNYLVDIDLPGYDKEDIHLGMKNGYLTVHATTKKEKNNEKDNETYVYQERYVGECARSFYVGENVNEEDVKASFKNGTLHLEFPKEKQKSIESQKYIPIE